MKSVLTLPGSTSVTCTPSGATSYARASPRPSRANLLALEKAWNGMPMRPPIELISTMRPPPAPAWRGVLVKYPHDNSSSWSSSWAFASRWCTADRACQAPACHEQRVGVDRAPVGQHPRCTPVRTESSSSTSMTRPAHPPEVVPRLLAPVTAQPAACNSSAQALPMPADAPVTSARLAPSLMGAPISQPAPAARRTSQSPNRMTGATPSQQATRLAVSQKYHVLMRPRHQGA